MSASYFYFILVLIILGNICQDLCVAGLKMNSCQKKSVQNSTASDCKEQKSSFQQIHSSEKEGHSWNQFNHLWVTDQAYV